jgi:hypothetical protein
VAKTPYRLATKERKELKENSSVIFCGKNSVQIGHEGSQGAQREFRCDLCVADVAALGTFVAKTPCRLATKDHKELKENNLVIYVLFCG